MVPGTGTAAQQMAPHKDRLIRMCALALLAMYPPLYTSTLCVDIRAKCMPTPWTIASDDVTSAPAMSRPCVRLAIHVS